MTTETWVIEPRDPLVFGDGIAPVPFVDRKERLPAPGTVSGMVRSAFVADRGRVTPEDAARLLTSISIRGPWMVQRKEDKLAVWVPAPHDGVVSSDGSLLRGRLLAPADGEGVLWPKDVDTTMRLIALDERGKDGKKVRSIVEESPLWPLDQAVGWALGEAVTGEPASPTLTYEHRVHVALNDETGTADAGMLFSSHGVRFGADLALAIEVTVRDATLEAIPLPPTVVLGGESRLSFRRSDASAAFPSFAAYAKRFDAALERRPRGLRLQLLTPACLRGDGTSAWRPDLDVEGLKLVAACIPGFTAVSGWDLQKAAPREVRRLVPSGSTYFYDRGELSNTELKALCEKLWCQPIEVSGRTDDDIAHHRATPAQDGYGLVLPGFWFDAAGETI